MQTSKLNLNQEIELKYRFQDENSFFRVKAAALELSNPLESKMFFQKNYFFDTSDFTLRANSLAIRLRQENEHFVLSIKGNDPTLKESKSCLSVRLEYEHEIDSQVASNWLEQGDLVFDYLCVLKDDDEKQRKTKEFLCSQIKEKIGYKKLNSVGYFINKRTCIPIVIAEQNLFLEMDETQFSPSVTHYEVELEIPGWFDHHLAEQFLINLFHTANASFFYSSGKAERFHQILASGLK